jgi:hypothetical protein
LILSTTCFVANAAVASPSFQDRFIRRFALVLSSRSKPKKRDKTKLMLEQGERTESCRRFCHFVTSCRGNSHFVRSRCQSCTGTSFFARLLDESLDEAVIRQRAPQLASLAIVLRLALLLFLPRTRRVAFACKLLVCASIGASLNYVVVMSYSFLQFPRLSLQNE